MHKQRLHKGEVSVFPPLLPADNWKSEAFPLCRGIPLAEGTAGIPR